MRILAGAEIFCGAALHPGPLPGVPRRGSLRGNASHSIAEELLLFFRLWRRVSAGHGAGLDEIAEDFAVGIL